MHYVFFKTIENNMERRQYVLDSSMSLYAEPTNSLTKVNYEKTSFDRSAEEIINIYI